MYEMSARWLAVEVDEPPPVAWALTSFNYGNSDPLARKCRATVAAVHYAAIPIGRVSPGLGLVVTVLANCERRCQVVNSVRASFHFFTRDVAEFGRATQKHKD